MKKLFALLLCGCLLFACAVSVSAAGTTTLEIIPSATEAKPGDKITLEVIIDGSDECTSFGFVLEYDTAVLEIVDGECSLKNADISSFDKEKGGFAYLYKDGVVPEGKIGTVTVKVKEGAGNGTVGLSGQLAVKKGSTTIDSSVKPANLMIAEGTEQSTDAPADTQQQTVPAQTEPQEQVEVVTTQPAASESQAQPEAPQQNEPAAESQPAAESETVPEAVPEAVPESAPQTAPQTDAKLSPTAELIITLVMLAALVAALIALLVTLCKRKKNKE